MTKQERRKQFIALLEVFRKATRKQAAMRFMLGDSSKSVMTAKEHERVAKAALIAFFDGEDRPS